MLLRLAYNIAVSGTANDTIAPVLSGLPSNISQSAEAGASSAIVTYSAPTATDNSSGAVTIARTTGLASGAAFPIGVTTVTYTATDTAGNVYTQSFTVTIAASNKGSVMFVINANERGTYKITSDTSALNLAITVSSGSGSSGLIYLDPGSYGVNFTVPHGTGVKSALCDTDSTMSAVNQSGTLIISSGTNVTCTITTLDSLNTTGKYIGELLDTRSRSILQHQPNLERRINRLKNKPTHGNGIDGLGFSLKNTKLPFSAHLSKTSFNVHASLSQARVADAPSSFTGNVIQTLNAFGVSPEVHNDAPHINDEGLTNSFQPIGNGSVVAPNLAYLHNQPNRLKAPANAADIWLEVQVSQIKRGDSLGRFSTTYLGTDYVLKPDFLVGLSVQRDWISFAGKSTTNTVKGVGWMITPYMTTKLTEHLYADVGIGWGKGQNKMSPFGTYTDSFNSERWLASMAMVGDFSVNHIKIKPTARLSYFKESTAAYADTLNVAIPSFAVKTGSFEFGPKISSHFVSDNETKYSPFITLNGVWEFSNNNAGLTQNASSNFANKEVHVNIETGVDFLFKNNSHVGASINYNGIGNDTYKSWGAHISAHQDF